MKKFLIVLVACLSIAAYAQPQSSKVKGNFRFDYYMDEPKAELIVYLPDTTAFDDNTITVLAPDGKTISNREKREGILLLRSPSLPCRWGITGMSIRSMHKGLSPRAWPNSKSYLTNSMPYRWTAKPAESSPAPCR